MAAIIFILSPHLKQVSTSMLKTLASSRAQGIFFFFGSSCFRSMLSIRFKKFRSGWLKIATSQNRGRCQVLYPVLKIVGVETGIIVSGKDSEKGEANLQDVTLALRYFLIELITILDSLTSAILTNAIYAELDKISAAKKSGTNLGKS